MTGQTEPLVKEKEREENIWSVEEKKKGYVTDL